MEVVGAHEEHVRLVCSIAEIQMRADNPPPLKLEMPVFRALASLSATKMWVSHKTLLETTHLSASMLMQLVSRFQKRGLAKVGFKNKSKSTYIAVPFINIIQEFMKRIDVATSNAKKIKPGLYEFQCGDCNQEYWMHNLARLHCPIYNEPRCACGGEIWVVWCKHLPTMFPKTPVRKFMEDEDTASVLKGIEASKQLMIRELGALDAYMHHAISTHINKLEKPTWMDFDKWAFTKGTKRTTECEDTRDDHLRHKTRVVFAKECGIADPLTMAVQRIVNAEKKIVSSTTASSTSTTESLTTESKNLVDVDDDTEEWEDV